MEMELDHLEVIQPVVRATVGNKIHTKEERRWRQPCILWTGHPSLSFSLHLDISWRIFYHYQEPPLPLI